MSETLLNGKVTLHAGDSRDVLKTLARDSIDSIVCDPPYALVSIVKRFDKPGSAPVNNAGTKAGRGGDPYASAARGFMGKQWDTGEVAFSEEFWAEVLRVLKPGGHVAAFGASRGYHRMACAIEDAGFEIRDSLMWVYGTGFPKSHDVSKGIDKAAGAEREVVGPKMRPDGKTALSARPNGFVGVHEGWDRPWKSDPAKVEAQGMQTAPATDAARQWEGWGTALKPAFEPIVLARKPLSESTVAANVLRWGTGALNIDGCRVGTGETLSRNNNARNNDGTYNSGEWKSGTFGTGDVKGGRWPANVVHDGSDEVAGTFPSPHGAGSACGNKFARSENVNVYGKANVGTPTGARHGDSGSAARFFYSAKASKADRAGSKHPTVKPTDLMQWLCRLVTPKGGTVLDPFAGSGTTGEAAFREGFNSVLIEREAEYQTDIRRRMALCLSGPDERKRESIKAKIGNVPFEAGSLFAGI